MPHQIKVIHLLPDYTPENYYNSIKPVDDDPSIDLDTDKPPFRIYFGQDDWHIQTARETLKRSTRHEFECWKTEYYIDRVYAKKINGINNRLFPTKYKKFGRIRSHRISRQFYESLDKEIQTGNVILHIHDIFNPLIRPIFLKIDLSKVPVVLQHHGAISDIGRLNKVLSFFSPKYRPKYYLRHVDNFFVLSNEMKAYLNDIGLKNVILSPMGVDIDKFCPIDKDEARNKLKIDKNSKIILSVGNLAERKGVHRVLEILQDLKKEIPNLKYFIVYRTSNKNYEKYIKSLTLKYNLNDCVSFYKHVTDEHLQKIYSASDIFVLPSDREPYGLVYIEALCHGLPVIASNNGGLYSYSGDLSGVTFIDPNNLDQIRKSVSKLFSEKNHGNNHEFKETIRRKFSWEKIIRNQLEVYDSIVNSYYKV